MARVIEGLSLTKRYIVALALIASLAVTAFFVLTSALAVEEQRAHIINIAGKQRMLSQRITLLISELNNPSVPQPREKITDQLNSALTEFQKSHDFLSTYALSEKSRQIYFGTGRVDALSQAFVQASEEIAGSNGPLDAGTYIEFSQIAKNDLLSALDLAVSQFEAEGTEAVNDLERTELLVLISTLLLLMLEAAFIFYPTTKTIGQLIAEEQDARTEAQLSSSQRQVVLDSIGHEIRTPLNLLHFSAQELSTKYPSLQKDSIMQDLKSATSDIETTVESVLNFNALEIDSEPVTLTSINVHDYLEEVAQKYQQAASQKGLAFRFVNLRSTIPHYYAVDSVKLRRIFENLLSNAVTFTSEGSVSAEISLLEDRGSTYLQIVIADTGKGISESELSNLFQPFVSSRGDGEISRGLGLGLTFTKAYVEKMGGQIWVEGNPGGGSLFRATMELKEADSLSAPVATITYPTDKPRNCLLAEDNPVNQIIVNKLLGQRGFNVDVAADGQQAIELATDGSYDLILLDIHMPIMNGIQACTAIRDQLGNTAPPIFAYTANATDKDRKKYAQFGFDEVIAKPINTVLLDQALSKHALKG